MKNTDLKKYWWVVALAAGAVVLRGRGGASPPSEGNIPSQPRVTGLRVGM